MAAAAAGFVVALAVYWLLQDRSARLPSASCLYAPLERVAAHAFGFQDAPLRDDWFDVAVSVISPG